MCIIYLFMLSSCLLYIELEEKGQFMGLRGFRSICAVDLPSACVCVDFVLIGVRRAHNTAPRSSK